MKMHTYVIIVKKKKSIFPNWMEALYSNENLVNSFSLEEWREVLGICSLRSVASFQFANIT